MSDSRSRSLRLWQLDARDWASEALLCVSCGEEVTRDRARIDIAGAHRHEFFNPQRVHYAIACFAPAHGCRVAGEQTDRFTWFAGYAWAIALCQRCGIHLGWQFVSAAGGHRFFGLIEVHHRATALADRSLPAVNAARTQRRGARCAEPRRRSVDVFSRGSHGVRALVQPSSRVYPIAPLLSTLASC